LVNLFRAGNDDAFRVIHDRYRQRLFVYARQMLGGVSDDAEDALQEIFVRAYAGLRANHRELALRAWLYRIAHNRCIDLLRRPPCPELEDIELVRPPVQDPAARAEQRDALKRLVADVQRLPEQQRSALLMRELGGMAYSDLAGALEVSVPAVKSLLVRARVGLAQAEAARDTACASIRNDVMAAHDRGVRLSSVARHHIRDCPGCREFRGEVRGVSRQFAALVPTLGPLGLLAKLIGGGSGAAGAGGGAAAGGSALAAGGSATAGGTAAASAGALVTGAGHVVTLLAAAVVTAGGAVEVQSTIAPAPAHHSRHHARIAQTSAVQASAQSGESSYAAPASVTDGSTVAPAVATSTSTKPAVHAGAGKRAVQAASKASLTTLPSGGSSTAGVPLTDPGSTPATSPDGSAGTTDPTASSGNGSTSSTAIGQSDPAATQQPTGTSSSSSGSGGPGASTSNGSSTPVMVGSSAQPSSTSSQSTSGGQASSTGSSSSTTNK
jgi:RNA polymerase sigma factor (sigma-70 family)